MAAVLAWFQSAPSGAVSVLTALIAAIVAFSVVALTQWILGRRARAELLTKKLEEVYLLLNQAASENVARYEAIFAQAAVGGLAPAGVLERSAFHLDLHKKIVMYVRLYFPHLAPAHQHMFRCNDRISWVIHNVASGQPVEEKAIHAAFGGYGDSLRNMEQEIIDNKPLLVREQVFRRRYKVANIHVPMPPPNAT